MVGETILHYNILKKLGEGGMGVVYLAEDSKLERKVAIKFLPGQVSPNLADRKRFEIEAKAAAALNHPNIATIHTIEHSDDEIFIVMEYIDGQELKQIVEANGHAPLQFETIMDIAIQIAAGLQAAHEKGIVHHDIKTSNIMVTDRGHVKIMDFGLAQLRGAAQITGLGLTAGTIAYMSPEQAMGKEVDAGTDIWSFGVVLFEMLTGELPFKSDYEQATLYAIINERPPQVTALNPAIPHSLIKIVDQCLEKKPSLRFRQAGSLIKSLNIALSESKKMNRPEEDKITLAVLAFADISPEQDSQYFSNGLTEEIITKLSKLKKVRIISRSSIMNYNRMGKAMKQIASELAVQYVIEGSVRKNVNDLRITAQLIDAKRDACLWAESFKGKTDQVFEFQEEVAARIVKALRIKLSPEEKRNLKHRTTQDKEAFNHYLKGRFFLSKRASEGYETAIRYFERAIERDGNYALAWSGIADTYNLMSDLGTLSSKDLYIKSMVAVRRALELDNQLSEAHTSLALLLMLNEWDWEEALKEYQIALKLNPNYATAHHWYGEWLLFNGLIEEALTEISEAVKLDPLSPAILNDKGMFLYYSRDFDGAIAFAKKSLELEPKLPAAYRLLSIAYLAKGMIAEAFAENKRWLKYKGNSTDFLLAQALFLASSGEKEASLKIIESITQEREIRGNEARGIALVYVALNEINLSFIWLEKALQERAESLLMLKVDPKLDPIRDDLRFNTFIQRVGLPN
jgi:serine/threonine-protein kinase